MQPYHPFQDLLDTYQSMSPLLQGLWLVVPPAFVAGMFALWLNYRIRKRALERMHDCLWEDMIDLHRFDDVGALPHASPCLPSGASSSEKARLLAQTKSG